MSVSVIMQLSLQGSVVTHKCLVCVCVLAMRCGFTHVVRWSSLREQIQQYTCLAVACCAVLCLPVPDSALGSGVRWQVPICMQPHPQRVCVGPAHTCNLHSSTTRLHCRQENVPCLALAVTSGSQWCVLCSSPSACAADLPAYAIRVCVCCCSGFAVTFCVFVGMPLWGVSDNALLLLALIALSLQSC